MINNWRDYVKQLSGSDARLLVAMLFENGSEGLVKFDDERRNFFWDESGESLLGDDQTPSEGAEESDQEISQAYGRGSMLAREIRLRELRDICDTQQTVGTHRLRRITDELARDDCLIARQLASLARSIRDLVEEKS